MNIISGVLLFFITSSLAAQRVLYSPFIGNRSTVGIEVVGKAGDYYWIQKERLKRSEKEQSFEIYDARMNLVKTFSPFTYSDSTVKEYFVSGDRYFDQLVLQAGYKKTILLLDRFAPDGRLLNADTLIGSFPFNEPGSSFLLVRSEDKNKMLLMGFESIPDSSPRIHAILFDRDWKQLFSTTYAHPFITQPFIQDDFVSYPAEYFNNSPVKLTNNGQWLMTSPSRTNHNFLLFHFKGADTGFVYKEIRLPRSSTMEDVALSINNENEEAYAGILSRFRYRALKNVQVIHYSLKSQEFDFDSSYRFNTLAANKVKNENLIQESFIAVPGTGFMLLKEYGRSHSSSFDDALYNDPGYPESGLTNIFSNTGSALSIRQDEYTRYNWLGGARSTYNRGDLSVFYFPAHEKDSCWSGMIDKEQITELNSPYLSYLVLPVRDKFFFLYNSFFANDGQYGSTTVLDHLGNPVTGEGVVFWRYNNTMNFQQSRQISENEVAIPYENYQRKGFAIIRF